MSFLTTIIQAPSALPPPQDLPVVKPVKVSAAQAVNQIQAGGFFSDRSLELTFIVLSFGLLALGLLYLIVRHKNGGPFELRIFTITILVFGSLLVVSAGFGTDQLGPVIGFFGTIAGYILGRGDRLNDLPDERGKERPKELTSERS